MRLLIISLQIALLVSMLGRWPITNATDGGADCRRCSSLNVDLKFNAERQFIVICDRAVVRGCALERQNIPDRAGSPL
jgi:hypothetical protein